MAGNLVCCTIDPLLIEQLKKFRFRRETTNSAIVMKVDRESMNIVCDEVLDDTTIDEVRDSLPDHQPRYVVYSFKLEHRDGRVSYPMCFIFSTPRDCKPELQMMYAGSKLSLIQTAQLTKCYEIREIDELTEEYLSEKLLN